MSASSEQSSNGNGRTKNKAVMSSLNEKEIYILHATLSGAFSYLLVLLHVGVREYAHALVRM